MDYNSTAFLDDVEEWYTGTSQGIVHMMDEGDTNAGAAITYEVTTKPIVRGSWHVKKQLFKLRVIADMNGGDTMNIYYSSSTDGNDWELIKTLTPQSDVSNQINMLDGKRSEWFRIKITGTGRPKIYSIAYEVNR